MKDITVNALRSHCRPRLGAIVSWALKEIRKVSIAATAPIQSLSVALNLLIALGY